MKNGTETHETVPLPGRIVVSSRVRLARNLDGQPFPGWAKKSERVAILESIQAAVRDLPQMKDGICQTMDTLSQIEKQVLVEKHLISREHAGRNIGSGVAIDKKAAISVMINEEDHIRMQAILPGFKLPDVYGAIDQVDSALARKLIFAFSPALGFLTACPTNVGTGMRASAMLHLPALRLNDHIGKIIQAVNKLGLTVRGLYGEGTEALGDLFQISNQTSLGEKEADILHRLGKVIGEIVRHEQNARLTLLEKTPRLMYDHIGRAYGILTTARTITSKETMNQLSMINLGVDLGFFKGLDLAMTGELFEVTQPAHLQQNHSNQRMSAEDRDGLRADFIRGKLEKIPGPVFPAIPPPRAGKNDE
ncbi:MAG: protein arginine kinase [Verrucomicrobiae bacterium]|nr:protein arginine kinase [Verrucomicrobiae bacterium]